MIDDMRDYYFDLRGYLVLENAVSPQDLAEMNGWVDDHWGHVEQPWQDGDRRQGRWIGHVHTHNYQGEDGVNFQNIVAAGAVFEKLIDHPSWIDLAKKYINAPINGLSIHENFLTVRGPGGYLYIHCGGHTPLFYLTFRHQYTGAWMVGQINVLIALTDIGPGDGATALIPGSHKSTEIHPRLLRDGKGIVADGGGQPAGTALGAQEVYLKAGDALFFTDAITHGSAERTNDGFRRSIVFRYSPRYVRERFNYELPDELLERLTPERRAILRPIPPRRPD
ncbi:MAG: phytanoyl-CoA dioxygenase family protein [Candidatus Poribacteria bacterium]|nr:phytanoyl-CoA dioxygenase family protein [Candidatus Poribacteria bacterium]